MPTSERQTAANRRNAQSSTGPRTPAGKGAMRHNAVTHGILTRDVVIADDFESAADFDVFLADLHADLAPSGALEIMLVNQIATTYWRLRRVLRAEAGTVGAGVIAGLTLSTPDDPTLSKAMETLYYFVENPNDYSSTERIGGAYRQLRVHPDGLGHLLTALRAIRAELDAGPQPSGRLRKRLIAIVETDDELSRRAFALPHDSTPLDASSLPALCAALDRYITTMETRITAAHQEQSATRDHLRAALSLPAAPDADRILRYEKALQNTLDRTLAELHRLQAARPASTERDALLRNKAICSPTPTQASLL